MSAPEPCWYVDRDVWGEEHYPTEAAAWSAAAWEALDDENPPWPVRHHDQPCREFTCTDCGGTYHAPIGVKVPADGLCWEC